MHFLNRLYFQTTPVPPAWMRSGTSLARSSHCTTSASSQSRSHCVPTSSSHCHLFLPPGMWQLAEGVKERAEAAGQTERHQAQVALHGPSHLPRSLSLPRLPGELEQREPSSGNLPFLLSMDSTAVSKRKKIINQSIIYIYFNIKIKHCEPVELDRK